MLRRPITIMAAAECPCRAVSFPGPLRRLRDRWMAFVPQQSLGICDKCGRVYKPTDGRVAFPAT